MIQSFNRLMAVAAAADVEAAKKKLLSDLNRAQTMIQKSVAKGDGSGKGYQAKLMALKTAIGEATTTAQIDKIRDQLNEAQASRRK